MRGKEINSTPSMQRHFLYMHLLSYDARWVLTTRIRSRGRFYCTLARERRRSEVPDFPLMSALRVQYWKQGIESAQSKLKEQRFFCLACFVISCIPTRLVGQDWKIHQKPAICQIPVDEMIEAGWRGVKTY